MNDKAYWFCEELDVYGRWEPVVLCGGVEMADRYGDNRCLRRPPALIPPELIGKDALEVWNTLSPDGVNYAP